MKIVSFGDVHMAIGHMAKIATELATADVLILSGDLANCGGREEAGRVLAPARSYCPHVLALRGYLVVHYDNDGMRAKLRRMSAFVS
ncbi:MAG: hypothetical protein HYZ50_24745 [Deltaproteobacteria bacterium]|nr:hypothetical protein [Deltaproteobacteria bacterium]